MCGHHFRRAIDMLKRESDFLQTGERFTARQIMRRDGLSIKHYEAVKFSKVANTSKAMVCKDTTFVNQINRLVTCAEAFELW